MLSVQSAMLVVLGFSIAGLLVCLLAPLYSRRTARLAIAGLKNKMPTTSEEIQAEQDRIRALHALEVHDLQTKLSALSLKAAHQLVEINKENVNVKTLEKEISHLKTLNEEHQNARRVLEVTITDRIPKIEQRLSEATKLLFERDHEIVTLTQSAQKQALALQEATGINTQLRAETESLNLKLSRFTQKNRNIPNDKRLEVETALRTENETLRARLREQAQTLTLLQKKLATEIPPAEGENSESEMKRLSRILTEAEKAFQATQLKDNSNSSTEDTMLKQISTLKTQNAEQLTLIQSLKAEITSKNEKLAQLSPKEKIENKENNQLRTDPEKTSLSMWNEETYSTTSGRRSLSELVNAPKPVNTSWTELPPLDLSLSQNDPLLKEDLDKEDPSNSKEEKKGEDRQEGSKKSLPKSGLLQRISHLEKSAN